MKNILKSLLLLFVFSVVSCTKDADIALPDYTPTLVIHSYISPQDSGVVVYVNKSKAAYNNNFNDMNNVKNATVKISDGTITKTLTFFPALFSTDVSSYFIDSNQFKIVVGKTYTLTVSTPDNLFATATTSIPSVVPLKSLSYERVKSQFGDSVYNMSFTFIDPQGADDYYKFGTYILVVDTVLEELMQSSSNEEYGIYFGSDGQLITEKIEAWGNDLLGPDEIKLIDFRLMHLSREYYLYHLSIQNYGGGPFSEPSIPFTNITGGVGVFAGYNYDQQIIR